MLKNAYFKLSTLIKEILKIVSFILIIYASIWSIAYAKAQKSCLDYEFENTYITWDLQPYCGSIYRSSMEVKPLRWVKDAYEQYHQLNPGSSG
jgi:hypothetical protein